MAKRGDGYNTKARQLILEYLMENRQHAVSAANIIEYLERAGAGTNPTTVYRYLEKLAEQQRVMKYVADKGEKTVFQYVDEGRHCHEHLHLKCVRCGEILHLECGFMEELRGHLEREHGFALQCEGSMLYGLCRRCRALEQAAGTQCTAEEAGTAAEALLEAVRTEEARAAESAPDATKKEHAACTCRHCADAAAALHKEQTGSRKK